jgi:hypothetical protein
MKRLLILLVLIASMSLAGHAEARKNVSKLEKILNSAGNRIEGSLEIMRASYRKRHSNIEEERWDVLIRIRNNASISSNCNVMLSVFNNSGTLLDEYLIFNDLLTYEHLVAFEDNIYIKRSHVPLISFARYTFSCIKKQILGR